MTNGAALPQVPWPIPGERGPMPEWLVDRRRLNHCHKRHIVYRTERHCNTNTNTPRVGDTLGKSSVCGSGDGLEANAAMKRLLLLLTEKLPVLHSPSLGHFSPPSPPHSSPLSGSLQREVLVKQSTVAVHFQLDLYVWFLRWNPISCCKCSHASLDKSIVLETSYFFGMRIIVFFFFFTLAIRHKSWETTRRKLLTRREYDYDISFWAKIQSFVFSNNNKKNFIQCFNWAFSRCSYII